MGTVLWAPPKAILQDLSGHRLVGTTENLFVGTAENNVGNTKKTLAGTIVYQPVGAAGSRSRGTNVGTVFIIQFNHEILIGALRNPKNVTF